MGVLRDRMAREMLLREFSASTQKSYLATLTDLARYHHQSPDTLDPTPVQFRRSTIFTPCGSPSGTNTPQAGHRRRPVGAGDDGVVPGFWRRKNPNGNSRPPGRG
jgi:hypothetical protein